MTTITKNVRPPEVPRLDINHWLRNQVFSNIWYTLFAFVLIGLNGLVIQSGFTAQPIKLAFSYAPNGQVTALGNLILTVTSGPFLTSAVIILWLIGAGLVIYSATQHRWTSVSHWLKDSLFTGFFGALTTLLLTIIIVFSLRAMLAWGFFGAEFSSDPKVVELIRPNTPGAVWGIVGANLQLFAIGRYPTEAGWRALLCLVIVMVLAALSLFAWNFGSPLIKFRRPLVYAWLFTIPLTYGILYGLPGNETGPMMVVKTDLWGGFLLTVVLSVTSIVLSFPFGLLLALGRRSQTKGVPYLSVWGFILMAIYWLLGNYPSESATYVIPVIFRNPPTVNVTLSPFMYVALITALVVGIFWLVGHYLEGNLIKTFCTVYIELVRGVPLITVLFMANIMLPIFLPKGVEIDNLLRVVVGLIMFSAAYLAEIVRGGLQSIPKGQYEAAVALGLSTTQSMRLIILPQALRAVIPAMVGDFIGLFKDTSLVSIVGLFDLLKIAQSAISQPEWLGLQRETYVFVAIVYWVCSFSMSLASQRLEKNLGVGKY